jgi:cell division protein FtsB
MSSVLRRLLFNVLPLGVMTGVVCLAIFGDHGLIRRHYLKLQQAEVQARIASLESQNAELRRKLMVLDTKPIGLTRLAAEEMMMAPSGSTIYRFRGE